MKLYKEQFSIETSANKVSYINITQQLRESVKKSNIQNGMMTVITPHTTCSILFEEFVHDVTEQGDEYLQVDLNHVLEKIIPPHNSQESYLYPGEAHYRAVESWPNALEYLPNGDRKALWNGDAHLKATLIGSSVMIDISKGDLFVGSTGYYYYADFDQTRERTRKVQITIIGE